MPVRFKITGLNDRNMRDIKQALTLMNGGTDADVDSGAFLTRDPNLDLDEGAREFRVSYTYRDWAAKWKGNWGGTFSRFVQREGEESTEAALIRQWGQPGVAGEAERFVREARDHYRGHAYPAVPQPDLAGAPDKKTALGTAIAAGTGKGACLSRKHGDAASIELLIEAINDGTIAGNGAALLGVEEFSVVMQLDLEAYLQMPPGSPLPNSLRTALTNLEQTQETIRSNTAPAAPPFTDQFRRLVQAAQVHRVPLVALDSGEASPGGGLRNSDPAYLERRAAQMNLVAERAMNAALARHNPNAKVIAACGAAHNNTHPGGIPGLSQIFGIPAVKVEGSRLVLDPEDATNRPMPTAVQQDFIEAFMAQVKRDHPNPNSQDPNEKINLKALWSGAHRLAQKLTAAGKLANPADVAGALGLPDSRAAIAGEVLKASKQKRDADLKWPAPGDRDQLLRIIVSTPELAQLFFPGRDQALVDTALDANFTAAQTLARGGADPTTVGTSWQDLISQAAAIHTDDRRAEQAALVGTLKGRALVDATERADFAAAQAQVSAGADPTTAGTSWQELMFKSAGIRNDARKAEQAALIGALAAKPGVNLNAQNASGKTVAHLAAWNGNVDALQLLHARGANLTLTDNRRWTPRQVAMASDKPAAENFFTANHIETAPTLLPADHASFDTVGMLMSATLCENPAHRPLVEAKYKELYSNPALRPVLDLIAADAARPRDPTGGGGLRIVAADGADVVHLYHGKSGGGMLRGAYADEGHTLAFGCNDMTDTSDTLMHELTHAAARLMYGAETIPAPADSEEMNRYKSAIADDVRNMHLLNPADVVEAEIQRTIAGRMDDYAERAPGQGKSPDTKLLQEFLVGVPQLIAKYGEDTVKRYVPNLVAYYKDFGGQIQRAMKTDPRFSGPAAQLDNTALDAELPVRLQRAVPADRRIPTEMVFTLAEVQKKLEGEFRVRRGHFDPARAQNSNIPYSADNYSLNPDQEAQLRDAKAALAAAWPQIPAGLTPPNLSFEDVQKLVGGLAANVGQPPRQLKDAMSHSIAGWGREAKKSYIKYRVAHNEATDAELAEGVVLRAEDKVFADNPHAAGEAFAESNAKKRKELIQGLTTQLATLSGEKKRNPNLVDSLANAVAGSKAMGFYKKDKDSKKGTAHVSIDVKNAKQAWLARLATF